MTANGTSAPEPGPMLAPIVQELQLMIENNDELMKLFEKAFQEIPENFQEAPDAFGFPRIRDHRGFIQAIDRGLKSVPPWTSTSRSDCVIGCPINEALIWFMNTRTGAEILGRPDVNTLLGEVLKQWAVFLSSGDSLSTLTEDEGNWLSVAAIEELLHSVNTAHNAPFAVPSLEQAFICDPSLPAYGFPSWDAFFTRLFAPGLRPVASASDVSVIVNPCESHPFALATAVPAEQPFSLKGTTYPFRAMLGGHDDDAVAARFHRGTVLQGWLSLLNYHRWHAPVAGTVVKVAHVDGTYFVADPAHGFEHRDEATGDPSPDRQAPDASQRLISSIATREVVVIEADDARIGCVGFVAIGMADVSGCVASVREGERVEKGQEIGCFHYGGSSYCLLFEEKAPIRFSPLVYAALEGQAEITERCIAVNSEIARVL
ncbi:phosphatidylserine decarboxylase family protein [Cordyceps fumosorosea ARSEF 2679]|uniref:Phosphatidylserine decarboxylase family protein n=1 Tax=Cordyceps fumosorosea (strain ARSEF 2679) TaxID=1081104 RepID=A0A167LD05_CORFA|nr:phosphatidylserine decarboxylase family protein [Cordyceps fumosorosea ARSEF 2679]OAA52944.1 phosphatidylserine decarboxylase family protein [Cordyceps fumosorosea ARSEF 2679]